MRRLSELMEGAVMAECRTRPMRIWYMRDNHTFLALLRDVDAAMEQLRIAFVDERDTYGSLCTKEGPMANKMEHAYSNWDDFAPRAQAWIEAALKPSAAELEYASWALTPNLNLKML